MPNAFIIDPAAVAALWSAPFGDKPMAMVTAR